ncbi:unnamed protein product [Callosobruchus maculatus]|uniref:Uncharacterized protein n=1 Tax=Callosobruchus maculatus TaxID=64391 RepID=A0A653DFU9_CALMS|nr:unnamed protein product [Callosobruchus maculatus]
MLGFRLIIFVRVHFTVDYFENNFTSRLLNCPSQGRIYICY